MLDPPTSDIKKATPFQRAVEEYIDGLPEKKRKRNFIVNCQRSATTPLNADVIHTSITKAEENSSKRTSKRIIKNVLGPVVNVLKEYYCIIDALVSANPLPVGLIWGALKVVIDGAERYLNLFETIKNELRSLTSYLQRITEYEYLYGDSPMLQKLLCTSYINILRFWSRVDKECERSSFNPLLRAVTSFSTDKLSKIVNDIKHDADEIQKLAPIIEARKNKEERENSELQRREERNNYEAWSKFREQQMVDRQVELYRQVCNWLSSQKASLSNQNRHRYNKARHLDGTCEWLLSHPNYLTWLSGSINPSVIWLRAPPGCGKSTLCSSTIQSIEESDRTAAIAFHFYQFDYSDIEVLRLLADQLFEKYWNVSHFVSEEIHLMTQKTSSVMENIMDLIKILVKNLSKTYFILDGLDEECESRWNEAQAVLDFLVELSITFPSSVRLWYSSQDRPLIHKKLGTFVFDITDQARSDVTYYLSRVVPELDAFEDDEEKAGVLKSLERKAEGNFLWASLMVQALAEDAKSLKEMKRFIKDGLPLTLDGYYRRIFERFEKRDRPLVSKMFALVSFARRPLRVKEIQQAIGLLQSNNSKSPHKNDEPLARSLRKLSAPLIEIEPISDDLTDGTCRLCHSTVRDFLLRYPEVLDFGSGRRDLRIGPNVIANACLLYLSQARYQKPLVRRADDGDTHWVDASGTSVERHHQFLPYSAKYWDKHLDNIPETDSLRTRVRTFLTSPNFLTCLQAQSLWVDGQFDTFCMADGGTYFRRVFPTWFVNHQSDKKLWKDFRAFMHEWSYLLACADPERMSEPYRGEIDRCLWRALGTQNFMSRLSEGRYTSFTFQSGQTAHRHLSGQCYEGISVSGDELRLIRLVSHFQGTLQFVCEHWHFATSNNALPFLQRKQTISTDEAHTNWLLYVKYFDNEANRARNAGRPNPISFSSDLQLLRIGSQIFREDPSNGNYVPSLLGASDHYPQYIEEFTRRGQLIVVASRRVVTNDDIYESGIRDKEVVGFGEAFTTIEERLAMTGPTEVESDDGGDDGDDEDDELWSYGSWSDPESSCRAYETWSECSTDDDADIQFEDDLTTPWSGLAVSLSENDESPSSSKLSAGDSPVSKDADAKSESSEPESDLPPTAIVGYGRYRADSSDDNDWHTNPLGIYDSDDDRCPAYTYTPFRTKNAVSNLPHASITVFDTSSSSSPMKIFFFTKELPFILYGSPPVVHPYESLVVWPLSSGDVLFADFAAKSYYVRKLRPSTAHTRHIFMKCHFSSCGRYLHIAALEGQQKPLVSREKRKKKGLGATPQRPLHLALLVLTFRLSRSKTTRGPPSLINLARIKLGTTNFLSVSTLPFTLTWTPEELFFTRSGLILKVYRIRLFQVNTGDKNLNADTAAAQAQGLGVLVPKNPIFLPKTATKREVYYFPPGPGKVDAQIIIGSEAVARESQSFTTDDSQTNASTTLCATGDVIGLGGTSTLPIGCYVKEADLGGWIKSNDLSEIPQDRGVGRLNQRLERFNPDEDCDLEPYIF